VKYVDRLAMALLAVSVLGCEATRPSFTAADTMTAGQLAGEWVMRLRVAHSPVVDFDSARAPAEIRGRLSLLANTSLGRAFPEIGVATNYGSYDLDLTPFGLDPRETGKPPMAVAGRTTADSIEIILSPEGSAGSVQMVGRFGGAAIKGVWSMTLRSVGAVGDFILERY
jgi:hypothetical protein